MRHGIFGKQLSRTANERKSLIRNIMRSLILHGAIKTTKAKAQATQRAIEKLITKAKKHTDAAKRDVLATLPDKEVVKHFYSMVETRFANRTSGYTRIVKIGVRLGDSSEQVILGFVDEEVVSEVIGSGAKKSTSAKATAEKVGKKDGEKKEKGEAKKATKPTSAKATAGKGKK